MAKVKTTKAPRTIAARSSAPPESIGRWQTLNLHVVTCPSGQRLKIRIPGIAGLLERGELPDELVELALLELTAEGGATGELARELSAASADVDDAERQAKAVERIRRYGLLQRHLAVAAIEYVELDFDHAPAGTKADVVDEHGAWQRVELTIEDTYTDIPEDDLAMVAEIAQRLRARDARGVRIGVEPLDRWAAFRDLHECGEDCPGCQGIVELFSTADVGRL